MQVLRIDAQNCREHAAEVALVHGVLLDQLSVPVDGVVGDPCCALERVWNRCVEYFGPPALDPAVWLFTGGLARCLLGDLPVHGCTLFDGRRVTVAVTWERDIELLARVFGHEWCHAFRLMAAGIASQGAYVRYLSEPQHQLYEEALAIATEKWLCPHLSWADAAGLAYSADPARKDSVYYQAYRLCCTRPVVEQLAELVQMPAAEGLRQLLS